MSDKESNAIASAGLFLAFVVVVLICVLIYKDCQNTDERVDKCIQLGKDPHQCECIYHPRSTQHC